MSDRSFEQADFREQWDEPSAAESDDLRVIQDYLDWQYALNGGFATEGYHKALVREERPMPTLYQAREAIARLRSEKP